jgi:RimJ/RimL family protein N-acetyltransferase
MTDKPPVAIRFTESGDAKYLKAWLEDPDVFRWFPMHDSVEIDDAVQRWISFSRYRCSLTATLHGEPQGIATLYLQPYRKLAHQCEFGIIVAPNARNQGIGGFLIDELEKLAKETFKIELLHLQVYEDNPAIRLYERKGFTSFGNQDKWIKELNGSYTGRKFMEKLL